MSEFQRTIREIIKAENLKETFAFVDNVTVCGKKKEELDINVALFHKVRKNTI